MRSKLEKPVPVPSRFARYRAEDWPGGWFEFVEQREKWNDQQERVLIAGQLHDGSPYAYTAGPLGDLTDLIRMRREARMLDLGVDSAVTPAADFSSEPEPGLP